MYHSTTGGCFAWKMRIPVQWVPPTNSWVASPQCIDQMMRSVPCRWKHHVWHWRWPVGWHPSIFQNIYSARIPGGTVLKRIKHGWQSANAVDNADGVGEECFAYVVLVPSRSQHWLLNRTDLANGIVQKLQGLDPIMQAAVRNVVARRQKRTFAAVTGLCSYLDHCT